MKVNGILAASSILASAAQAASISARHAHAKFHAHKHLVSEAIVSARDIAPTPTFPFKKIVAFGDDMTDNGQGSFGHGITGNIYTGAGKLMWGNGTFTDGQVAVSYMSQNMNVPLTVDYAFGSSDGAEYIGSVCDSALVAPTEISSYAKLLNGNVVPSAKDQVANYTSSSESDDIADTLHFFWTGNNDVIASIGWVGRFTVCTDGKCDDGQQDFIGNLTQCYNNTLNSLVDKGAKYVVVPNVYPRHLSPWTGLWITATGGLVDNFGDVIDSVNSNLKQVVDGINEARGTKIMYYDANSWFKKALGDTSMSGVAGAQNGYTDTCVDGCTLQNPTGQSNWDMYWDNTIVKKLPDDFFWMTEVVPSTTVMKSLGNDIAGFISQQDWSSDDSAKEAQPVVGSSSSSSVASVAPTTFATLASSIPVAVVTPTAVVTTPASSVVTSSALASATHKRPSKGKSCESD